MTLLLTGFGPFPGVETNPSGSIVEELAQAEIEGLVAMVLPTEFEASFEILEGAIREHQPDTILMLGVSAARPSLCLERFALNWIEDGAPDAAGVTRCSPVVDGAPLAHTSTLPLETVAATLAAAKFPFELSSHAGTYVCNCLFYRALHGQAQADGPARAGFIHVPMPRDVGAGANGAPRLADLVDAIRRVVTQLIAS